MSVTGRAIACPVESAMRHSTFFRSNHQVPFNPSNRTATLAVTTDHGLSRELYAGFYG